MNKKIVIVGGVAGGASAAAKLRRLHEEDEIIMFERGPHVSFSNCALPYHLSDTVSPAQKLVLMSPDRFMRQYRIQARINQEVTHLHPDDKKVTVMNHLTGETYEETYDKLILSPGAKPILPPFPGLMSVPTFTVRNVVDITTIKDYMQNHPIKKTTVIGGGYIGIEVAENLIEAGYEVTLIEADTQILRPFDNDMVQILHKVLHDHNIEVLLNSRVSGFEEHKVLLDSGKTIETDMVVMAIGVSPENTLAKEAGIELTPKGSIKVNAFNETSIPDIYAIGDAVEVIHELTGLPTKLTLAGPAVKQARDLALHINDRPTQSKTYIGSSAIKVFDYNAASTGLNEGLIKVLNLDIKYNKVYFILNDKVGIMPNSHPLHFKLLYEIPSGKILGAQAIGKGNVDKRVDVIATAIKFGGTVYDLQNLELCYAPPFGTAKDIVNYAGYIAGNLLEKQFNQIFVDEVRLLVERDAHFIDVREKLEYDQGHLIGAFNMPLSEIRERTDEIPKDKPLYVYCRTGQRSYNAVLLLQQLGYTNVFNVTGGFLGLSFYEYFKDKTEDRASILSAYNFN